MRFALAQPLAAGAELLWVLAHPALPVPWIAVVTLVFAAAQTLAASGRSAPIVAVAIRPLAVVVKVAAIARAASLVAIAVGAVETLPVVASVAAVAAFFAPSVSVEIAPVPSVAIEGLALLTTPIRSAGLIAAMVAAFVLMVAIGVEPLPFRARLVPGAASVAAVGPFVAGAVPVKLARSVAGGARGFIPWTRGTILSQRWMERQTEHR
jgi:hypothetical protein